MNLLPEERDRLGVLEAVVTDGLHTFIGVGHALLEIRDRRLYRETHPRFKDYLRDRWEMSQSRGYQLMDAAAVSTIVEVKNEAQARKLAPVVRELRANGATVTADQVRQVLEPVDVEEFSEDTEGVCPTCHGTGRIPIEELGGRLK